MTTIVFTGYEPFGAYETNPTARLAKDVDGRTIGGATVVGRELPVAFDQALPEVVELIETHDPIAVLSTGLMPGRAEITVERVGINVRDVDGVPDNADRSPVDKPVVADGPVAYLSTLPIRALVAASSEVGVPASVSNTAGTHLCNNILYATRHHVEQTGQAVSSGFVHTPFSHEQAARNEETVPSMSYEVMKRSMEAMIACLAEEK